MLFAVHFDLSLGHLVQVSCASGWYHGEHTNLELSLSVDMEGTWDSFPERINTIICLSVTMS